MEGHGPGQRYKVTHNAFHTKEEVDLDFFFFLVFAYMYQMVYEYITYYRINWVLLLKIKPGSQTKSHMIPLICGL